MLSKRELESRFEVWVEQYAIRANIEAETADSIARTMILPAAMRYLEVCKGSGVDTVATETRELVDALVAKLAELKQANSYPHELEGLEWAVYARDKQLAKMAEMREIADQLERMVADSLWPLPKYSEMLFIR